MHSQNQSDVEAPSRLRRSLSDWLTDVLMGVFVIVAVSVWSYVGWLGVTKLIQLL